ncbi:MAG: Kelch repeat-containing protein [Acidobacteriaceae bacterium]
MTLEKRPPHFQSALFVFPTLLLLTLSLGCGSSSGTHPPPANAKEWTWSGGSNMRSSIPSSVYGTEGVASAANIPGGRASAVSWTDSSGNFWLFGGGRVDPLGTLGPRNDLWKYTPASKEWTWVSGSSTTPGNQLGIYGTKGTAAAANVPGGRAGSVSWIDSSNNLWLFGGGGFDSSGQSGVLNDLWEYNSSTQQWTWVSGSNAANSQAVYGTVGVAAAANVPGARGGAISWTDHSGNFWLFGGVGFDSNGNLGSFNDLWEFSPSSKEWTWVSGSSTVNAKGVYGSLGMAASGNVPGSRYYAVSWTDSSGNLWLFGGYGYDSTGGPAASTYGLNDLWEFSASSKEWTWMSGTSTVSTVAPGGATCVPGVYGTEGTAAAANTPGGRGGAVAWIDASDNLWLFAGLGCDASGTQGSLNDLWEFNATNKAWTWQSGSNSVGAPQGGTGGPSGVYGTQGTAASANTPGGREESASWIDSGGNLWVFGGNGHDSTGAQGMLNDMWSYTP